MDKGTFEAPTKISLNILSHPAKTNVGSSSNPPVRDVHDGKSQVHKLMKCKISFTDRHIYCKKCWELANNFKKLEVNILSVVNHRIAHEKDIIQNELLDNFTLKTGSSLRKTTMVDVGVTIELLY